MSSVAPRPTAADYAGRTSTTIPKEIADAATANFRAARQRAEYLLPWTGVFLRAFAPIQTERISTLAVTEDMYLLYNPMFFQRYEGRMGLWEFGITFLHESLHIFYKHFPRQREYQRGVLSKLSPPQTVDGFRWNCAGDCEINSTLVNIVPVNPILAKLTVLKVDEVKQDWRFRGSPKAEIHAEANRLARQEWEGWQEGAKYPTNDWPEGSVSMPQWFLFPDKDLDPPQPWNLTAEHYYPFTQEQEEPDPNKPKPPPPPWRGFNVGARVVDTETGEEGIVVAVGAWNEATGEQDDVEIVVTNSIEEESRSMEDAEIIGRLRAAKIEYAEKLAEEAANPTEPEPEYESKDTRPPPALPPVDTWDVDAWLSDIEDEL